MYIVAQTDAGLVRETNQDRYLVWKLGVDGGDKAGQFIFCAVADGMGGSAAGDRASAMTLSTIADRLLPLLVSRCGESDIGPCDVPRLLVEGTRCANMEVFRAAQADPTLNGMGTTLTAGLAARGVLYLAQVGDSRCYRLRAGILEQQTSDHSIVGELVRLGRLTSEEARRHPRRNIITRAVGVQEEIEVDITCQVIEENDLYLFCSDGLWELVPDSHIQEILLQSLGSGSGIHASLEKACARLVLAAMEEGGDDNVTVLLAAVDSSDLHPGALHDAQAFARTRVESGTSQTSELKKTLRYRLQEWQQE